MKSHANNKVKKTKQSDTIQNFSIFKKYYNLNFNQLYNNYNKNNYSEK